MIDPELLELARRQRRDNPRPPLTAEQERIVVAMFGQLQTPRPVQRVAA